MLKIRDIQKKGKKQNTRVTKLLKLSNVFFAVFINMSLFSVKRRNREDSNVKGRLKTGETCQEQCVHSHKI